MSIAERTDFIRIFHSVVAGIEMSKEKATYLELPENLKLRLIEKAGRIVRRNAKEAKAWRELLLVDNLTINGRVVWNENHRASMSASRKRQKKRHT